MFAAIYQAYLKPGREQEYRRLWSKVARYFAEQRGAIGSCLHRTPEGLWVAYSRWPDKATRDASWPGENTPSEALPEEIRKAVLGIKECIDHERRLPELSLEVVEDLLLHAKER